ncbi:MAG: GNAT family N-acetyltransferase [Clostridium sp.]
MQLTPWLGALYVNAIFRGRGIAKELMNQLFILLEGVSHEDTYM